MKNTVREIFNRWNAAGEFSGVVSVSGPDGLLFEQACGYRNRAERLPNEPDTAFAIASGTKFFTALAACQLIDSGRLTLDDRVWDVIPHDLKRVRKDVTVFHLLTHTSGIGDYIDEEASEGYADILKLYENRPVHQWDSLPYYLPLFHELPPKFAPGERFGYSNAGFILLGLAIEGAAGQTYHQVVEESLIRPLGLSRTGFYRMNSLPGNTALGYHYDESRGEHVTNVLYMPVVGGSDGGIFTCAADLVTLWKAVLSDRVFSAAMRETFFTPHTEEMGLGVYLFGNGARQVRYTVGGDFGVDFFSAHFPRTGIIATALGNTELNTFPLCEKLFEVLG